MKEKLLKAGEKKMPTFQLRHEVVDIGNRSGWSALIRNWCIMEDMEWSEGRIILDTSGCRFPFLSYASGKEWEERIHFWEFVLIRIIIIPMSSPAQAKRGVSDASCVCGWQVSVSGRPQGWQFRHLPHRLSYPITWARRALGGVKTTDNTTYPKTCLSNLFNQVKDLVITFPNSYVEGTLETLSTVQTFFFLLCEFELVDFPSQTIQYCKNWISLNETCSLTQIEQIKDRLYFLCMRAFYSMADRGQAANKNRAAS